MEADASEQIRNGTNDRLPVTIELAGTNDDVVFVIVFDTLEKRDATLLAIFRKLVTSST